ncbi:hypothetical protein [Marinobacter orientalis]|uniref:Transmembrane protein n=1 Tax=Marinobacter orientalis TaxID=1928859 RepID=A0A7Y0RCL5_9GAMM|nr:hypothetical protein [Marinobacter orientalis]NMT63764.1 hypothetical protein [Marinobacter orientalis]TGX49874.1 hypothetical protein DIT72_09160 [Marinobacter orientalis]
MMDAETNLAYGIFWALYAVAFVVFFYMMARLLRIIPVYAIRTLLQAALVVIFLTPVESAEVANWYMPAWLHGGYETILGDKNDAARAFLNFGIASAVMLLVWMLDLVRYRLVRR